MSEKKQPKRKLPKKSKRAKRRYILFQFKAGSCKSTKQAFDLITSQFSLDERKRFGLWFIEFKPTSSQGIVRCRLGNQEKVRKAIVGIPKEFEPKTLAISGTLRKLRAK